MTKVVYIAGKVTGDQGYFDKFMQFEFNLKVILPLGTIVINPAKMLSKDDDWHAAMRVCKAILPACDELYLMDDWHESIGATIEVVEFLKLERPIYLQPDFQNDISKTIKP